MQYFYSSISLIELKWLYIKLEKNIQSDQAILQKEFNRFQNILLHDKRFLITHPYNSDINLISDSLRNQGHTDYFDTLIAGSALWYCDAFMTEDQILRNNINRIQEDYSINTNFEIYSWKEFMSK
jgi:hypothetical protein